MSSVLNSSDCSKSDPIDITERGPYSVDQFPIVNDDYKEDLRNIRISHGEIKDRVSKMALEIAEDYKNYEEPDLYAVCVLEGALKFFADLIYNPFFGTASELDSMDSSRYGDRGTKPSEEADIWVPPKKKVEGKDLLLVEDIVDTGGTMDKILDKFEELDPKSIKTASLLNKKENREVEVPIDYVGFDVPLDFLVGYGLDYKNKYRNLRHLCVLKEEIYEEE